MTLIKPFHLHLVAKRSMGLKLAATSALLDAADVWREICRFVLFCFHIIVIYYFTTKFISPTLVIFPRQLRHVLNISFFSSGNIIKVL